MDYAALLMRNIERLENAVEKAEGGPSSHLLEFLAVLLGQAERLWASNLVEEFEKRIKSLEAAVSLLQARKVLR